MYTCRAARCGVQVHAADDAIELAKADAVVADRLSEELQRRDKHSAAATLASKAIHLRQEVARMEPLTQERRAEIVTHTARHEDLCRMAVAVAEEVDFSEAMLEQLESAQVAVDQGSASREEIVGLLQQAAEQRHAAVAVQRQAAAARDKVHRIQNEVRDNSCCAQLSGTCCVQLSMYVPYVP